MDECAVIKVKFFGNRARARRLHLLRGDVTAPPQKDRFTPDIVCIMFTFSVQQPRSAAVDPSAFEK